MATGNRDTGASAAVQILEALGTAAGLVRDVSTWKNTVADRDRLKADRARLEAEWARREAERGGLRKAKGARGKAERARLAGWWGVEAKRHRGE